jgi:hypothetical protein
VGAVRIESQSAIDYAIEVDGEAVGAVSLILHEDVERVSAEISNWLG